MGILLFPIFPLYAQDDFPRLFKFTIDTTIVKRTNHALEEYKECPPLRPERFRRKVKMLWGIDINDYPKNALIWFGSDFRLSVTYQTIHGFFPVYDDTPVDIPTHPDSIYTHFRKYLFYNDQYAFNVLNNYTKIKYEKGTGWKLDSDTVDFDLVYFYDFLFMTYHSLLFNIPYELIKYIDQHAYYSSSYGLCELPDNAEIRHYQISNMRINIITSYIAEQLKRGRKFTPNFNRNMDIWLGFNLNDSISMFAPLFSLSSRFSDNNNWIKNSVSKRIAAFLSMRLEFRNNVQNKLVSQYMSGKLDYGLSGSYRTHEINRNLIVSNNYYGHAILREFCENPEREMATLEKIGSCFKGMANKPNTLLYLEPYPDSYNIDTIQPTENFKVYEMGYDDYYFVEIIKPVESPVAGPDGYAMILDRTETVYGYLPREDVKEYSDAEILKNFSLYGSNQSKQGIINNPDGYVNIRSEMNSSAGILGKIEEKEAFNYWELPDGDWWIVQTIQGIKGFVHKSRIREQQQTRSWIIYEKE